MPVNQPVSIYVALSALIFRWRLVLLVRPDELGRFLQSSELLVAERLVLLAEAADLPAYGVQLAVGSLEDLLDLAQSLLHTRHLHALTGRVLGNVGGRVHHPLTYRVEVAPSGGDDLG
jgi:hypothetical protein